MDSHFRYSGHYDIFIYWFVWRNGHTYLVVIDDDYFHWNANQHCYAIFLADVSSFITVTCNVNYVQCSLFQYNTHITMIVCLCVCMFRIHELKSVSECHLVGTLFQFVYCRLQHREKRLNFTEQFQTMTIRRNEWQCQCAHTHAYTITYDKHQLQLF